MDELEFSVEIEGMQLPCRVNYIMIHFERVKTDAIRHSISSSARCALNLAERI